MVRLITNWGELLEKLAFRYTYSVDHKDVRVDGALGGPSPRGDGISMSVYTEASTLPELVVHELTSDGHLGPEIQGEREPISSVDRRVHVTLHMRLADAKALHDWIGNQISMLEKGPAPQSEEQQ